MSKLEDLVALTIVKLFEAEDREIAAFDLSQEPDLRQKRRQHCESHTFYEPTDNPTIKLCRTITTYASTEDTVKPDIIPAGCPIDNNPRIPPRPVTPTPTPPSWNPTDVMDPAVNPIRNCPPKPGDGLSATTEVFGWWHSKNKSGDTKLVLRRLEVKVEVETMEVKEV